MIASTSPKTILDPARLDRCGTLYWRRNLGIVADASGAGLATTRIPGTPAAGARFKSAACSRQALRISSQVWKRSLGSLGRALRLIASMPPARAGLMSDSATGRWLLIL